MIAWGLARLRCSGIRAYRVESLRVRISDVGGFVGFRGFGSKFRCAGRSQRPTTTVWGSSTTRRDSRVQGVRVVLNKNYFFLQVAAVWTQGQAFRMIGME